MKLLETKEQLTLNELLRIAYEYGNDNAEIPTDSESVEKEFSEWIKTTGYLFKKLIIPHVIKSVCENCKYFNSQKHHDKMWCRDCQQKNHFEQTVL